MPSQVGYASRDGCRGACAAATIIQGRLMRTEAVDEAGSAEVDTAPARVVSTSSTPAKPAPPSVTAGVPWTPPTWEEVVREHSARVYRLAYRLTGNCHDAEDLTQEVFVRVF